MANLLSTSITGTATTSDRIVIGGTFANNAYNSVGSTRLHFGGGDSDANSNYYIGTNLNNYGGNYTKLDLRWHTGIRMGARPEYGGIRFFNNEALGSRIMSIGETDANVRIDNNLYIGGAGGWITDLLAAKQNASTAITTGNIGSQSVSVARQLLSPNDATVVAADSAMPSAGHSFIHTLALGPGGNDGHILGMSWAGTTSIYGAQIFLDTDPNDIMAIRSRSNAGVWTSWKTIIHSGTIGSQSVSYATSAGSAGTAGSAGSVDGLTINNSGAPINPDNVTQNQIGYNTSVSLFGQTDGGLYSSAYSSSWIHQIYGDFRSGQIAIRGKNSGTWGDWRIVVDDRNIASYAVPYGNMTSSTGLNDNKLYLRTNGDNNHYLWNAADDWEELVYYNGTGFRVKGATGTVPAYFTEAGVYASAYRGKDNVGGTGTASWHPDGIYSGGTQWLYGTTYRNNASTSGQGQMYFDGNYGYGMVGLYASTRYQAIFAMGDAYKLPVDGTTTGSLYGLAWSHPNAGGVAGNLNTHGLLVMENGTFLAAISGSIRARDDMRAPIFYDSNDTNYYLDPTSTGTALRISGGIVSTAGNGAVLLKHENSEANAWIFRENAANWGLFWFNAGGQSGQTIGSYTTIGAELFGMNNAVSGFNPNSAWSGTDASTRAAWMLSNYSGYLWTQGTQYSETDMRAPIFYDSNNTGYYGDFASTSVMNAIRLGTSTNNGTISGGGDWGIRFANDNGWIQFGPANNSWTHIYSDKNFYFNQNLYVNGTQAVLNSGTWGINISGNAASASSVAWSNVSSKPAGWLDTTNLIQGREPNSILQSGFYESYLGSGNPTGTWFNYINVRHSNPDNGHGYQIGMSYYDNNLWFRSYQGAIAATFQAWSRALGTNTDPYPSNMDQYVRTSDSVSFLGTTSPTILVNGHSDNTKGYRIHNTSGTSVSAMFTNSSNQLVIAAGAVDQINLNKKVLVNAVALGVNIAPSATAGRIDASNDIVAFSSSDERLKENITPIANALDKVKSLTGVEFDWKPEHKEAHGHEGHDTGIIAQQVLGVMPTAVRTNDTGYLAVRYEKLIGLLIEANKELAARVEELEKKLN